MAGQQDVRDRIQSVKNIHKITRAMQMVAAARLRRAEQRIERLRPYADAMRRMTRKAAAAAQELPQVPILQMREEPKTQGLLLLTGDRGLAGAFNANIIRYGVRRQAELAAEGIEVKWYIVGRKGLSSLNFRGMNVVKSYTGFTDRPSYSDAREVAADLMTAYVDGELDRVGLVYNQYISPLTQRVTRQRILPLQQAEVLGYADDAGVVGDDAVVESGASGLWEYEPDPEVLFQRLAEDSVEVALYRAMLESTASEHGARMTAMRNAAQSAEEMIDTLTLEANRARQAEITQEIMEVVAGAEALS